MGHQQVKTRRRLRGRSHNAVSKPVSTPADGKPVNPQQRGRPDGSLADRLRSLLGRNPQSVVVRLALAKHYLLTEAESEIVPILKPLENCLPLGSDACVNAYNQLLCIGLFYSNRFSDAERAALRALARGHDSPAVRFVLVKIYARLREVEPLVEAAGRYLYLYERERRLDGTIGSRFLSDRCLSEVHVLLGSARMQRGEFDIAEQHFQEASRVDPGSQRPYLELASLAQHRGDHGAALAVIERGSRSSRQVHELGLMADWLMPAALVSACMIVKDEQELLPGCLQSLRGWVDEIIVVDTGSTDGTVKIAEEFGAKVFRQSWEGDFSKHRNYSIEQATGQWIFVIDADERFSREDVPRLIDVLRSGEHQVLSINVFNLYRGTDHRVTAVNSVRFFRRDLNLRYEGIVHNTLRLPEGVPITRLPLTLEHLGYDLSEERMAAKFRRTRDLLKEQLDEDSGNAFAWFNLAQLYRGRLLAAPEESVPQVLEASQRVLDLTDPDDPRRRSLHLMALDQLGWTHFYQGHYRSAERYALRSLELKPEYLDPLMLLGHVYSKTGQLSEALNAYRRYLEVQAEYDQHREIEALILYHSDSRDAALYGMGLIAELQGDRDSSKVFYRQALETTPGFREAALNLGRIHMGEGDFARAEEYFTAQLDSGRQAAMAALGLGCVRLKQGRTERAEKFYRQALELEPGNPEVLLQGGQYYDEIGCEEKAVRLLGEAVLAEGVTEMQLRRIGDTHCGRSRWADAAAAYGRIDQSGSATGDVLNDLGNCCFNLKQYNQAQKYYCRALQASDAPVVAQRNLGSSLLHQGSMAEAATAYQAYLALVPSDPEVLLTLGDIYTAADRSKEALGCYEKVLLNQPDAVGVIFKLAKCYLSLGHRDSAVLGLQRVLELDSSMEPARRLLQSLTRAVPEA